SVTGVQTCALPISVIFSLGRRYEPRAACAAAESDGSPNMPASGMAEVFRRDLRVRGFKLASSGSVLQILSTCVWGSLASCGRLSIGPTAAPAASLSHRRWNASSTMAVMKIDLAFGKTGITFDLPAGFHYRVLEARTATPLPDWQSALDLALD